MSRQSQWVLVVLCVLGSLAAVRGLTAGSPQVQVAGENQCIVCHTNVKKLIRLGWEVEKTKPNKGKSTLSAGEG